MMTRPKPQTKEHLDNMIKSAIDLHWQGELDAAYEIYQEILEIRPHHVDALHLCGVLLGQKHEWFRAEQLIQQAIQFCPNQPMFYNNLANIMKRHGAFQDSLLNYQRAICLAPERNAYWESLSDLYRVSQPVEITRDIKENLLIIFQKNLIPLQALSSFVARVLVHLYELDKKVQDFDLSLKHDIYQDPLLIMYLENVIIVCPIMEKFLGLSRKKILISILDKKGDRVLTQNLNRFIFALAKQCYFNEYGFIETSMETHKRNHLEMILRLKMNLTRHQDQTMLALLCCYAPLSNYGITHDVKKLNFQNMIPNLRELINLHLVQPDSERKIANTIPKISSIRNEISYKVQKHYERKIMPKWQFKAHPVIKNFQKHLYDANPEIKKEFISDLSNGKILVIGCGTGQEAIELAQTFPKAQITAIDLCLTLLSYGKRMAKEHQIKNVNFVQADILELEQYADKFDYIQAIHVIQHLRDPLQGLKVIQSLLRPSGLLNLQLDSQVAMRDIELARTYVEQKGFKPIAHDLDKLRTDVMQNPVHPINFLRKCTQFYAPSLLIDLLFPVEHHLVTLQEMSHWFESLEFRFLGFTSCMPNLYHNFRTYSADGVLDDLLKWHEFEQAYPDSFKAGYQCLLSKQTKQER